MQKSLLIIIVSAAFFLGVFGLPEAEASYGNVKSIQTGITGQQLSNFIDITITAVNPSKTIVFCNTRLAGSSSARYFTNCELVNSTTLRIDSGTDGSVVNGPFTAWQVIEFDGGINVQRDVTLLGSGTASTTVTIATVDATKAFIVLNNPLQNSSSTLATIDEQFSIQARFTDTSTIQLGRNETGVAVSIPWQVVELDNAAVQSGLATILDQCITATLSPAVNQDKTFIVHTAAGDQFADGFEGELFSTASTTDTTTVQFCRDGDNGQLKGQLDISWFAVEMTDTTKVQFKNEIYTAAIESDVDMFFAGINAANSTPILSIFSAEANNGCANDVFSIPFFVTSTTTGTSVLRMSRAAVNSLACTPGIVVHMIEWPKRQTRLRGTQIRLRGREIRLIQNETLHKNAIV